MYNRLEDNFHLSNKKALFFNMTQYYKLLGEDPFNVLPLTFHIEHGLKDPEFDAFKRYFNQLE
jgi:tubulin--tyrosine ligase